MQQIFENQSHHLSPVI